MRTRTGKKKTTKMPMRLKLYKKGDKARYEQLVFNEEAMRMNCGRTFTAEEASALFAAKRKTSEEKA